MTGPITARCQCGQLSATCQGDPVRVSVCHCHNCQRRSGSAFSAQIRFPIGNISVRGDYASWTRTNDSGSKAHFHFCPVCGSTLFYELDSMPGVRAVAMGGFAGVPLPTPQFSVYEARKAPWLELTGEAIEHHD